jgi:hypothetical protein
MEYYVYYHRDPVTNQVKYVGKGKGQRAFSFRQRFGRHRKWIEQLKANGLTPIVEIVFHGTEREALNRESDLILAHHLLGCDILLNTLTKHGLSGGRRNGMFGKNRPDLSERNKGNSGLTIVEIHGKDKADRIREKLGGTKILRNDGKVFFSIKSAAKEIGTSRYLLKRHLEGHLVSVNEYRFQYVTGKDVSF